MLLCCILVKWIPSRIAILGLSCGDLSSRLDKAKCLCVAVSGPLGIGDALKGSCLWIFLTKRCTEALIVKRACVLLCGFFW